MLSLVTFVCLASFVLSWVSSCLLSCFALSCSLPIFPSLLPGNSSPLSQVKFLVLWVLTWRLDWCNFWDSLQATESLSSCLTLPLDLPPPRSSPLPPLTGSMVIPPARIVLSALPLCLDLLTPHSPCCCLVNKTTIVHSFASGSHFLQTRDSRTVSWSLERIAYNVSTVNGCELYKVGQSQRHKDSLVLLTHW